jgi:hypothetical protein
MLAEINPVALPALRIGQHSSSSSIFSAAHISFEIVTGSSIKIQLYRRILSPSANSESRWF